MAFISDAALDAALAVVAAADVLHICSQEPTTFTEATSTYTLGNKAAPTIGAAGDRVAAGGGRKRTVAEITDGDVTGTGTATHWALTTAAGSVLQATGALSASQAVTDGNPFTLAAFDIGVPDAV